MKNTISDNIIKYITDNLNDDGECEFSLSKFSSQYGYREDSVCSALDRLKKKNMITMLRRGGKHYPSLYRTNNLSSIPLNLERQIESKLDSRVHAILSRFILELQPELNNYDNVILERDRYKNECIVLQRKLEKIQRCFG